MFGVFQYMKTWLITYSIGIGFSCLNVYSNAYIYVRKTTNRWYRQNKTIKNYTNMVMNFIYGVFNRYSIYKIEPFYDLWLSVSYKLNNKYDEDYINLDTEYFSYCPSLDNVCVSVLHKYSPKEEDIAELFAIVYNQINKFNYCFYDLDTDFLILFKSIDKYICRVGKYQRFLDEYVNNITLNKIKKPFLCVEYFHHKMEKKIYLDIDAGFFVENNEILSPMFVQRCLVYQKESYVFDLDYKIHILDNMLKTIYVDHTSYILITKNGYEIKQLPV